MKNHDWVELGGTGPPLVFAHANGFPVASYEPFLGHLKSNFSVVGWEARPLHRGTDPQEISSWRPLAVDLRDSLGDRFDRPIIAVGHSLGGVLSLLASVSNPELFDSLVLLDPVLFSGRRSFLWGLMKRLGQSRRMPLWAGAMKRREFWPDRDAVRRSWRGKPTFEGWTDQAFEAYIRGGFEANEEIEGIRLRYPKAWEARIFELTPHHLWKEVSMLAVPTLVLRGEFSDTFFPDGAAKFQQKANNGVCRVVDGTGHMLPMQKPELVASIIKEWLSSR